MDLQPKSPSDSAVTDHVYKIFSNDLNSQGTAFGGTILSILDRLALVIAERHSGRVCVTVSIDAAHFLAPAKEGDNLIVQGCITRSWRTSMEIGLKVTAENGFTRARKHILSAYFTFVALDGEGKPTLVPPVLPVTKEEKRRYEEADRRRNARIQAAKEQETFRKHSSF